MRLIFDSADTNTKMPRPTDRDGGFASGSISNNANNITGAFPDNSDVKRACKEV